MTNHKKQYQSKYLIPAKCWENAKFIRRVYPQKKYGMINIDVKNVAGSL